MEKNFKELVKKIRTREELIFILEEITQKKCGNEEEVSELEKKLQSLPQMRLEIAFPPDDDFLNKITQWLEKELYQKIILDLIINPKIVSGAIIECQGKWHDFSLAKKIDQLISQKISSNDRF